MVTGKPTFCSSLVQKAGLQIWGAGLHGREGACSLRPTFHPKLEQKVNLQTGVLCKWPLPDKVTIYLCPHCLSVGTSLWCCARKWTRLSCLDRVHCLLVSAPMGYSISPPDVDEQYLWIPKHLSFASQMPYHIAFSSALPQRSILWHLNYGMQSENVSEYKTAIHIFYWSTYFITGLVFPWQQLGIPSSEFYFWLRIRTALSKIKNFYETNSNQASSRFWKCSNSKCRDNFISVFFLTYNRVNRVVIHIC